MNPTQESGNTSKLVHMIGLGVSIIIIACGYYYLREGMAKISANSIKVGVILPLSGENERVGKFIRQAFDMAVQEINSAGGVSGQEIQPVYEDDAANPSRAAQAMQKFANRKDIPIVFGSWASSCVIHGQAKIAEDNKLPVLAMAQSPKITTLGDYIFRIQPSSPLYLDVLVPYAIKRDHHHDFIVVHIDNDFGQDLADYFVKLCAAYPEVKVHRVEKYGKGDTNFRDLITRIKGAAPPNCAVFLAMYAEAGEFLRRCAEQGFQPQFYGAATLENIDIITTAGAAAEGLIYAHHYDPDSGSIKMTSFLSHYRTLYNEQPEGFAALGYDAAYVIKSVLEKGTDRERVKESLYNTQHFEGITGEYSFDSNGDVTKPIFLREIRGGKFTTIYRPTLGAP